MPRLLNQWLCPVRNDQRYNGLKEPQPEPLPRRECLLRDGFQNVHADHAEWISYPQHLADRRVRSENAVRGLHLFRHAYDIHLRW